MVRMFNCQAFLVYAAFGFSCVGHIFALEISCKQQRISMDKERWINYKLQL